MINYEEESIVDKENQVLNELDVLNKMPNNSEIDNQEDFNEYVNLRKVLDKVNYNIK